MRARANLWAIAIALALAGCDCGGGDVTPGGDGGGRRDTGGSGFDSGGPRDAGPQCVTALPVDMLFVVDNSNSMMEEQNNLAVNFRELIDVLTAPPDADMNGEPDYPAVEDLRIGVVSTDLGIGSATGVSGCDATGDDAQLVTMSRSLDPACMGVATAPDPWLSFHAGDDPAMFSQRFSCMGRLGTNGCGLEQQLEASLRGASENPGFVRPDSLLAVVLVTDEEDCSATDDRIFDPTMDATLGTYGTRCADHPELLHPVDRYAGMLAALRPDRTADVVFAAITGVPRDLVDVPDLIDYDEILGDMRMQYTRDPMDMTRLEPACEVMGVGSAIPARRIVQVVQQFAATGDGIVQSICSGDLRPAIRAIAALISRRLCPPLL